MIHIQERITGRDDERGGGNVPFELIELGDEGIGKDEVIVNELTIGAARAIGYAPAEDLAGAGEDLGNGLTVLEANFIGVNMVAETAGLDDGEKAPANFGLLGLGELDRNDAGREGTVEQGPEAFTDASGVNDNILRMPGRGQAFELAKYGKVIFADPTVAVNDMVGGMAELGVGGEVDLDDGKGGGITAGVAEAEVGGRVHAGFVHASDIEEERRWGGRGQWTMDDGGWRNVFQCQVGIRRWTVDNGGWRLQTYFRPRPLPYHRPLPN
jgi:hypothetical protein